MMRIIISRLKKDLNFLEDLIESKFDDNIPYYLIKIHDDYHFEMFLVLERINNDWKYFYLNHEVYYSGGILNNQQLKELIEMLKEDKRSWKDKIKLTKEKKSKKLSNKYIGLQMEDLFGMKIESKNEQIEVTELNEQKINLGVDETDEYEFINTWENISPFFFKNKLQYQPFMDDIKSCLKEHRWKITTDRESMEVFLECLPDVLEDVHKIDDKVFYEWLINESKKIIKDYKIEIDDDFKYFLDKSYSKLGKMKKN